MVSNPSPLPATLSPPESADQSAHSTRTGRLRSLSYLRNYTQNHLFQPNSSTSPTRSRRSGRRNTSQQRREESTDRAAPNTDSDNYLSPTDSPTTSDHATSENHTRKRSPARWLPTVGGLSGLSRTTAPSQETSTTSPSAELSVPEAVTSVSSENIPSSMARTRAGNPGQGTYRGVAPTYSAAAVEFSRLDGASNGTNSTNENGPQGSTSPEAPAATQGPGPNQSNQPTIRFIAHQDPRSNSRPSLQFQTLSRTAPNESSVIKVGRYSEKEEKSALQREAGQISSGPVGFKSKVVSRRHCEFWCQNGQWFIKDVKSSSGTFLNHIRLSQPNVESRPFPVNDGDVVQLGIDFKGGEEMIFRCVKIKIECNRGWQKSLNNFNMNTHKQIRTMTKARSKESPKNARAKGDTASTGSTECSICLYPVSPCQSLFVAPCSHVWHYKCIRPMLNGNSWPQFLCPNCRAISDLEAEVDEPARSFEDWEDDSDLIIEGQNGDAESHKEQSEGTNPADSAATNGRVVVSDHDADPDHGIVNNLDLAQIELAQIIEAVTLSSLETDGSHSTNQIPGSSLTRTDSHSRSSNGANTPSHQDSGAALSHQDISSSENGERQATTSRLHPVDIQTANSNNNLDTSVEGQVNEGPMTPRNDAGPFVFDGSGSQESRRQADDSSASATKTE